MPELDLDFEGVGEVPEGWFRLSVDKAVLRKNRAGTGDVINLQMHLVDMPEEFEMYENLPVYDSPSMSLSSRWKIQKILEAITGKNWKEDGMKLNYECSMDCGEESCPHEKNIVDLEDKTVVGLIYKDTYEGVDRPKVNRYLYDDGNVEFGPEMTE